MNKQEFKDSIYQELSTIAKALANPYRLRILNLLSQDDYSVEQIADDIGISIANTSQHLQVLKKTKLLKVTKQGHYMIYSLTNSAVYTLLNVLQNFGLQHNLEIKETRKNFKEKSFDGIHCVKAEEILANNSMKDLYFLDVRPKREFEKEAISGAHSIPIEQLENSLQQLPKNREIIVYCRGPLCVFADKAVQYLKKNGFDAVRLQEEVLEWKQKGLPVN